MRAYLQILVLLLPLLLLLAASRATGELSVEEEATDMFEAHSAIMLLIEPDSGAILRANKAAADFYGWDQATLESMFMHDINTLTPAQVAVAVNRALNQERSHFVFRHRQADGEIRTVEVRTSPIRWKGIDSLLSIVTDIGERESLREALEYQQSHLEETIDQQTAQIRNSSLRIVLALASITLLAITLTLTSWLSRRRLHSAEARSREQHQRLEDILVATGIGTWEWQPDTDVVAINERFGAILGRPGRGLTSMTLEQLIELVHPEDGDDVERNILDHLRGATPQVAFDARLSHFDGEWVWVRCRGRVVRSNSHGKPTVLAGTIRDISNEKFTDEKLHLKANYDALTGLPNRGLFVDRLLQAMRQVERSGEPLAVAFIDLDDFKPVNDNFGHEVGDETLVRIAARMLGTLREGDTLARVGGDEFVTLLPRCGDRDQSAKIIHRLLLAASETLFVDNHRLVLGASIGVTTYPQQENLDADQLIRQADQAMYTAKGTGKNRIEYFDPKLQQSELRVTGNCRAFFEAMEKGEVHLYYQPHINMHSGALTGAEALIRWQHPEKGLRYPRDFLSSLTTQEHAKTLGEWVLRQAIQQICAWENVGFRCPVSINVDVRHLQTPDFTERVSAILAEFPALPRELLEFEILETGTLEESTLSREVFPRCRDLGIRIALDDFGTGYSSLSYLKSVQADDLKVDRSFVVDMLGDADDLAIIKGVLGLATAFNRRVIAEGVESEAHGRMLLRLGCPHGQGFFIGKPMPAPELLDWTRSWEPPRSWARTESLSTKDHLLLAAQVEARGWRMSADEWLRDVDPKPRLGPQQSSLGKWLKGASAKALRNQPEILALHKIQDQIVALEGILSRSESPDNHQEEHVVALIALCDEAEPLFEAAIQSSLVLQHRSPRRSSNLG